MTKSDKDIMEILEAYDLTRCAHSAAQLAGVDEKTVARYVPIRDAGGDPLCQTADELNEPRLLAGIDAQHGTTQTGVLRRDQRRDGCLARAAGPIDHYEQAVAL